MFNIQLLSSLKIAAILQKDSGLDHLIPSNNRFLAERQSEVIY